MFENKTGKKRPLLRILSLTLVMTLLHSVIVTQFGGISRFVDVFAEGDPLSRIYALLQGEISHPETYEDYYQLASIAIGKGEYEQALAHLDKCEELAEEGDNEAKADLWLKKASLYMLKQDFVSALRALDNTLAYDPNSSEALLLRAQIRLDSGDYATAVLDMERHLELVPDDLSLLSSLAQAYEKLGRFVDASACYEMIFAKLPSESSYRLNALRCLFLAEDYKGALAGFDAYLADGTAQPELTDPQVLGEENPAQNSAETAVPVKPEHDALKANAYFLRAACQTKLNHYPQAVLDFESAIVYGYDEALCLEQLVISHYAQENFQAVIDDGERLSALDSVTTARDALYHMMGVSAMSLERYESAAEYLTLSINANASLAGNAYYRGVSLLALGRQKEAINDFTKSIEQGYLTQYCYYNRGVCYVQLLDYENALDDMDKTLTTGDEQSLKNAATNILWQLVQYYENKKNAGSQDIEAQTILE